MWSDVEAFDVLASLSIVTTNTAFWNLNMSHKGIPGLNEAIGAALWEILDLHKCGIT